MPAYDELRLLGNNPNPDSITADELETFPKPENCGAVTFETDEVTSRCPKTNQPDYYTIILSYVPRDLCLESKSLKLYYCGFRDKGNFIETMVTIMRDDFVNALDPLMLRVVAKMKPRGGISIEAESTYFAPELGDD